MPLPMIVHIILMVLMFVLVITAAGIARKRGGGWFPRHRRTALLGAASGVAGIAVMFTVKLLAGYPHFKSPHAITGAIVLAMLIITPLFGMLITRGKGSVRGPHKVLGRVLAVSSALVALTGVGRALQITGKG